MAIYKSTILIPSRSPVTNIHNIYSKLSKPSTYPWTRTGSLSIVTVFPRSCIRGTVVVSIVYHQDADRRLETERFSGLPSTPSSGYHGFRRLSEVIQSLSFPPFPVQERELGGFARFPAGSGAPSNSRERSRREAGPHPLARAVTVSPLCRRVQVPRRCWRPVSGARSQIAVKRHKRNTEQPRRTDEHPGSRHRVRHSE